MPLCQTGFHFHHRGPHQALQVLLHPGSSVGTFLQNIPQIETPFPQTLLNKHRPATNMQSVWNETSLCVFSSRFSLGCSCVCGLPTNSKAAAVSYSSQDCGSFLVRLQNKLVKTHVNKRSHRNPVDNFIVVFSVILHVCHLYWRYWCSRCDVWTRGFDFPPISNIR